MRRWMRPALFCLLLVLPVAWLGCGLEHKSTDPAVPTQESARLIGGGGDVGGGGTVPPAPACPVPLFGEAEWTRMSLVDVMVALRLEIGDHASALTRASGPAWPRAWTPCSASVTCRTAPSMSRRGPRP